MATLKSLRDRRQSVKSTQKITMAMKMVAGAKLRRAQERVEAGRPYAHMMHKMLQDLADKAQALETPQPLLVGSGQTQIQMIIVATSDRGLCGAFNSSIIRQARRLIASHQSSGREVKLLTIGQKAKDLLRREYESLIVESYTQVGYPRLHFSDALQISEGLIKMYEDGEFDVCTIIYNHFKSAIVQEISTQQLIPIKLEKEEEVKTEVVGPTAIYEYEPTEDRILSKLLPQNVAVQIYKALLENAASEQGARMTAMDNASRNAGEMIRDLTLRYNRTRQAQITRELIEIISGAEALNA